ncbi:MAG TPA: gamma-glutamylcyclotransferase [Desulfitobacteriaceae bacterium]|nr:gamma-glutamylcyclotransferase [Desulfitobacteriaceae bacterium]
MDPFFSQPYCDMCGKNLKDGHIMSMFNEDCICMECLEKEKLDKDYGKAVQADLEEIKQGNYNFKGIRGVGK